MSYKKTVLENGISVITEALPHFNSVAVGIWVRVGSRDEGPSERGMCHFIEHTVFKGTGRRTASQIVRDIEAVGGSINAFTAKEYTCFHARVLGRDLSLALDVLGDLLRDPLFDPEELEREKAVVLQEIKMTEDNPEDYVHEVFFRTFWKDHPLGSPITGEAETVGTFTREAVKAFFEGHFVPEGIIVAAAGNLEHGEVVKTVSEFLGGLEPRDGLPQRSQPVEVGRGVELVKRDLEQVHLCLGVAAVSQTDANRFPALVLNTILGGNMSSRLFQEVREKRGLVYSIYSFLQSFTDAGVLGVYAGTTPRELERVLEVLREQWRRLARGDVGEGEVSLAKEYLKGGLLLSLESPEGRMSRLAKNEIYHGRYIPLEETVRMIDSVTVDQVIEVAEALLEEEPCMVLLGEVDGKGWSSSW